MYIIRTKDTPITYPLLFSDKSLPLSFTSKICQCKDELSHVMNTNTYSHAKRELEILCLSAPEDNRPIIEPFISELLLLCEAFGKSGQSGGSAPYTATALSQAVKKLCLHEPICPITGIENEWVDVSEHNDGKKWYQNNRCFALFKDGKDGIPYYLDAIIFKSQDGNTFTSHGGNGIEGILSTQYLKALPFIPKSFYIDVISEEVSKGLWEHKIKDWKQLRGVWKYYKTPA